MYIYCLSDLAVVDMFFLMAVSSLGYKLQDAFSSRSVLCCERGDSRICKLSNYVEVL